MSVWENVMDKSSWQPDIQHCIRGITMEAVTNTQSNNHSDQIPHTKMPKLKVIKVTNCYNHWLKIKTFFDILILLLFESFLLRFAPRHPYKGKGQTFINPTIKLLIVTIGLLIGTYPCVSKLDNDQVQGQPPCHSNHFQHHQITHELTRIFVTRFPGQDAGCTPEPLPLSVLFLCLSLGCIFWQARIVTNQSSHICLMTPTLPWCSGPSPIGYKLQALDSSIVKMALLSVLMCYKPFRLKF